MAIRSRHPLVSPLLVSVGFGLAAGVVGALLVAAYLIPPSAPRGAAGTSGQRIISLGEQAAARSAVEDAGRSAAAFYVAKSGADPLASTYVPGDAVGAGLALTSDGWIIAHAGAIPAKRKASELAAVIGGKAYAVRLVSRDPFTDVVFLKADAANLPVAPFGSAAGIAVGDPLFAFDAAGGLHRVTAAALDIAPPRASADLVLSSERAERMVRVSGDDGILPGAMVLDQAGEVIGIYAKSTAFGGVVVPFDAFSKLVATALKEQPLARPFLGLHYIDLARLRGAPASLPERGALLASLDGKLPAVAKGSPADLAGLRAGDVIVAVNDDDVTAKNPLADLVAEYDPGSAVSLTVERVGGQIIVNVTLGRD